MVKAKDLYLNSIYIGIVFQSGDEFMANNIDLNGGVSEVYLNELDVKIKFL
jgi:hypothetical protein